MIQYKVEYWSEIDEDTVTEVGLCEGKSLEEASRAIQDYYGDDVESVQFFFTEMDDSPCWPMTKTAFDKRVWEQIRGESA